MPFDKHFQDSYRALEQRMQTLAEADGDVFLPNVKPTGPVDIILIGMEPSLGRWARSADEAKSKVAEGFRNFLSSWEDFILHYCVQEYLCGSAQRYHITDLSKGAMLVGRAQTARSQRYDRWYALMQEEMRLIAAPNAEVIAVGSVVARQLRRRNFPTPFTTIIHYSGLNGKARSTGILGREDAFCAFRPSVSEEDLLTHASEVLESAHIPLRFREETLMRLRKSSLTTSRLQLMFNYKLAFETMRT